MNPQETKKLEQKVLSKLSAHISPKDTVILGLSGGPDSVFLNHFLQQIPSQLITAHLNHQLRGKDSDKDAEFCRKIGTNHQEKSLKINSEEHGRKERYKFFEQLAKKHQAKYILTAHHADDNLETILFNLTRGATLKGLGGMQEFNAKIFRPLLEINKTTILDYLKTKKIPYRKDKSNQDSKYSRNRIRLKVIPELLKINPNLNQNSAKNASKLREINDYLELQAQKWLKKQENPQKISAKTFRLLHPALQKQVILEIHKFLIGNSQKIESTHIEEVLKLIHNNNGNKKKRLGKITFAIKNNIINVQKI